MLKFGRAGARPFAGLLVAALAVGALAACRPMTPPESELFEATNRLRAEQGLPAYAQQDALVDQARAFASTMAERGKLGHSNPSTWDVAWTAAGENVGAGPSVGAIFTELAGSEGHRANLISTKFTHMAVGTAQASDGKVYVVQLFWRG
jgi:uncharacterized protein YkwD